jgi:hypothetical protein
MASPSRLLGSPDLQSLVQGGVLWLKPRLEDFTLGVELLNGSPWTKERGWNSSGPPHELVPEDVKTNGRIRFTNDG